MKEIETVKKYKCDVCGGDCEERPLLYIEKVCERCRKRLSRNRIINVNDQAVQEWLLALAKKLEGVG